VSAVVLSQAIYWQLRCKDGNDGWWWKTDEDWKEETGLGQFELTSVLKDLTLSGALESTRKGMPARKHYRVNIPRLSSIIRDSLPDSERETPLPELMKRPVAYHRMFVTITGSVKAALLLSQAMYWQGRVPAEREGWWWKTASEWNEEIGLSRRELETARKKLRELGILEDRQEMLPSRVWYRVNKARLNELMESEIAKTHGYSSVMWKTPSDTKEEEPKPANNRQFRGKRHRVPWKTPSQYTETTSDTKITPPTSTLAQESLNTAMGGSAPASGERLDLKSLYGLECPSWVAKSIGENRVCKLLKKHNLSVEDARKVLAEFAAAKLQNVIGDEAGYFISLCKRAGKGTLEPSARAEGLYRDIRF